MFSKFWPFLSQSAYEGGFLSSKIWSFTWGCRLWLTSPPKHVDLAKWFTQKLWRWALHTLMLFSWRLMATLITILGWVLLQNCSGSCFCILKLCLPSLFPCGGTINVVPWPRKGSLVCFYAKRYDTENVWIYGLTTLVSTSNLHFQYMCSYDTIIVVTNPWSVDVWLGTSLSTRNVRSLFDRL